MAFRKLSLLYYVKMFYLSFVYIIEGIITIIDIVCGAIKLPNLPAIPSIIGWIRTKVTYCKMSVSKHCLFVRL